LKPSGSRLLNLPRTHDKSDRPSRSEERYFDVGGDKDPLQDLRLRDGMESGPIGVDHDVFVSLDKNASLSAHIGDANAQLDSAASPIDLRLAWLRADNALFVQDCCIKLGNPAGDSDDFRLPRPETNRCAVCLCGLCGLLSFIKLSTLCLSKTRETIRSFYSRIRFRLDKTALRESPNPRNFADAVVDIEKSERAGECYVIDDSK
jgi:hypothetical protein